MYKNYYRNLMKQIIKEEKFYWIYLLIKELISIIKMKKKINKLRMRTNKIIIIWKLKMKKKKKKLKKKSKKVKKKKKNKRI